MNSDFVNGLKLCKMSESCQKFILFCKIQSINRLIDASKRFVVPGHQIAQGIKLLGASYCSGHQIMQDKPDMA